MEPLCESANARRNSFWIMEPELLVEWLVSCLFSIIVLCSYLLVVSVVLQLCIDIGYQVECFFVFAGVGDTGEPSGW